MKSRTERKVITNMKQKYNCLYNYTSTYYGVHLKTYKAEILYNLQQLNLFNDIFLWDNIHYRAVLQQ